MTLLNSARFAEYFEALHGYGPFPWQERLAAHVLEEGRWPNLLDIPTGLGKTSAIDVALFALAVRPEVAPRRVIMVVDRRVVVDQAADHARRIQERLIKATDGVLKEVATALRALWSGPAKNNPFEVAVLRGGMPRDEAWAQRPDRPVVALSTVDQVGSRLLFNGYGVSAGMAPVHAGLLGNDTLLLLDEVQLSTAFAQTLNEIETRWRVWHERANQPGRLTAHIPNRWGFVRMSATPVGDFGKETTLPINAKDRAHPVVRERLGASKVATLAEPILTTRTNSDRTRSAVQEAFVVAALEHVDAGAQRLAVIVNRVATATDVHEELGRRIHQRADVVLLTGRMRPLDRDDVMGDPGDPSSVAGRVIAGVSRSQQHRPVVVVSTQTIEAGADFDFDALVTECASIDALRQRFGRLDRRGELKESRATILIRKDQANDSKDDPVYGSALSSTWTWLLSQAGDAREVNFGIDHFPSLPESKDERAGLCSPVTRAPVLLPAHIDAWAQTNPRGEPDPEVALWLHGPARGTAEVRVVWRADIDEHSLLQALEDPSALKKLANASLGVSPPSSLESISVSIAACRAWLARKTATEVVDVEGASTLEDPERRNSDDVAPRPFLLVEKSGVVIESDVKRLYPEATIVVPASYGGIRSGNWNPDAKESVRDLGDLAQLLHRGRAVLRLIPAVLRASKIQQPVVATAVSGNSPRAELAPLGLEVSAAVANTVPKAPGDDDPDFKARTAVGDWLQDNASAGEHYWELVVGAMLKSRRALLRVVPLADSGYFAATGGRVPKKELQNLRKRVDPTSDIVNDDDDTASYIGREVALDEHLRDVERWVRLFAEKVGLGETVAADLALAARLHDIGKADPRFQQMLHGGSAIRLAASTALIAKSRGNSLDRAAREEARIRAEYPAGYRHEILSVAMLECNERVLSSATDRELVLHLVGSHHGWCRPFAPGVQSGPPLRVDASVDGNNYSVDAAHRLAQADSGIADRFWLLCERYGWWTLAWFEALVRLADHRASEEKELDSNVIGRAVKKEEK